MVWKHQAVMAKKTTSATASGKSHPFFAGKAFPRQAAIFVNGTVQSDGLFAVSNYGMLTGQVISLSSGDVVTLVNHTSTNNNAIPLPAGSYIGGSQTGANAVLTIMKIG